MKPLALLLLGLALLPLAGQAGERPPGPCRTDAERLCPGVQDRQAGMNCLLDNQRDLSDACYGHLRQRLAGPPPGGPGEKGRGGGDDRQPPGGRDAIEACRKDAERLCAGIQPGGGRLMNCLIDRQKDIAAPCYDQLAKLLKAAPPPGGARDNAPRPSAAPRP